MIGPGLSLEQKAFVAQLIEAGAANSAQRLSHYTKVSWSVASSSIELMTIAGALDALPVDASTFLGVHMRSRPPQSPLTMESLILFPSTATQSLLEAAARAISPRTAALPNWVDAMAGEIANVIGQALVKAMADRFGSSIILSVPFVSSGPKPLLLAKVLDRVGSKRETIVFGQVELAAQGHPASCTMMIVFELNQLRRFQVPPQHPI
ncbi:MAG TPA: hypothetical protein DCM05_09845 [Elusimicrobia bacterium]|nr:hypothetical protein [Elusimicrobiota bacterium]